MPLTTSFLLQCLSISPCSSRFRCSPGRPSGFPFPRMGGSPANRKCCCVMPHYRFQPTHSSSFPWVLTVTLPPLPPLEAPIPSLHSRESEEIHRSGKADRGDDRGKDIEETRDGQSPPSRPPVGTSRAARFSGESSGTPSLPSSPSHPLPSPPPFLYLLFRSPLSIHPWKGTFSLSRISPIFDFHIGGSYCHPTVYGY